MASDTAVDGDRQAPGSTSDISRRSPEESPPGSAGSIAGGRRGPGGLATVVPARFAALYAGYAVALGAPGGPLDGDTVRAYCSRVRGYLAWLADADPDGNPLTDPAARDGAVRDYRGYGLDTSGRGQSASDLHRCVASTSFR